MLVATGAESMGDGDGDVRNWGDGCSADGPCRDGRERLPTPRHANHHDGGEEPSLLVGADKAAELVGVSRSEFYRLDVTGQVPSPVPFGKVKRWVRSILKRWADAGCPARHSWEGEKR